MEFVEFQVKKGAAVQYSIIKSLFDEKKMVVYKDGERLICYVNNVQDLMGKKYYDIQDVDGTMTANICSDSFFKITDFKHHSKRFNFLKQSLKIKDI